MNQHLRKKARLTSFLRQALKPLFAVCALAPVFAPHHAAAQTTYFWEVPAGGNWDFTSTNWSTAAPPAAATVQWNGGVNGAPFNSIASFGVTPTAGDTPITVNQAITLGGLNFTVGTLATNFYDIQAGAGSLTFTGQAVVSVSPGVQALITIPLTTDTSAGAASDTLTFTANSTTAGAGTIFLNGNNGGTYSVPLMTVTGGATVTDSIGGSAFPNVAVVVGVTQGSGIGSNLTGPGTLDLNGGSNSIQSLAGAANGTITNSNTGAYANLTIGNVNTPVTRTEFMGQITDSVGAAATNLTIETTNNVAPVGVLGITIGAPINGYALTLSGTNNNYNGMTVVGVNTNVTTLKAGNVNAFSAFSAINVNQNSFVDLAGLSQQIAALNGTGTGTVTNLIPNTTAVLTLLGDKGTDTLSSSASIVDKSTPGLGSSNGVLNLVKSGGYTQILAGIDSYGGTTTINQGQLAAGSVMGLSANSSYTITSPGILNLNTFSASVGSLTGNGTVENVALAGFVAGPVTLTTGMDNTSTTFSGAITGAGGSALTLTKTGTGTFTLTGGIANTYTGGTNINQGTLSFSTNSLSTGLVTFTGTSTLQYQPGTTQDVSTINGLKLNDTVVATIDTNNNNVPFNTALQTGVAKTGSLTKTGLGTLTLNAVNTYAGGTNINQGTVSFINGGLGTGTTTFTGNSTLQWAAGNTQDVSLNGLAIVAGFTGTLDTGVNNVALTKSLLTGAGAGVTKIGAGVLTLGGTNTYTGATTVNAGTVKAGTAGGLSLNSAFNLGAATFLDVNGLAPTIGSLTGTGTVTNTAAGAGTLITGNDGASTGFNGLIKDGTGTTALTKIGTGTFTLNTANTYSGGTSLQNGTLVVANANALGVGNVTVSGGALQVGGSNMNINVGKNYTQTGGELDLRIGGTTTGTHDQLTVAGAASLSGKLSIAAVNGYTPKNGDIIPIVTAAGGVSGTFAPVTGSLANVPLVKLTVNYLPGEVDLDFSQGSFMAAATILQQKLTPNERAVANALDHVATNSRSAALLSYLDALPFASLPAAYDRIAPAEYGAVYEISRSAAKIEAASIENRLDEVHAGAPAAGGFTPGANGPAGPEDYKGSKEVIPPPNKRLSVFANGSGEFVNVGDTYNAKGYNFDSGAATVGIDYLFTDHFLAGVLLNYTGTEADLTNGGRIDANAFRGGVYATLFGGGAYVNAFAGGAYSSYDLDRRGLNSTVRGNTDGSDFNGLVTTGYDVHAGGFTYGPVVSFQYTYTGLNGFNETGSLAPLHIQSGHGDSILTNVGARASYDWHIGSMVLVPEVRATWQHEYGDDSDAITAAMLLGSPVFRVISSPIGRDSLVLNAGFTLKITADISAYAFYDGELARTNYQANNVMLGFRTSF